MPGSDGLRILGDLKKKAVSWDPNLGRSSWDYEERTRLLAQWVEIWRWTKRVDFRIWTRPVQLCATGCAARCWVRWNSQHSKNCVSLSPRVEKPKSQKKLIKVSYLNYRELSVFRVFFGFLCIWTYYISIYFTYSPYDYITLIGSYLWIKYNCLSFTLSIYAKLKSLK